MGWGDGGGLFVSDVATAGSRNRVEARGHEKEGQLVQVAAARGDVLQHDTISQERYHYTQEAEEEPEPVGVAGRVLRRVGGVCSIAGGGRGGRAGRGGRGGD